MNDIKVGDIVVCIDNMFQEHNLSKGQLYRVVGVDYENFLDPRLTLKHTSYDYYQQRFKKLNNPLAAAFIHG